MEKVNLPKVEEETRTRLNILKAKRNDKNLDVTLKHLRNLEPENEKLRNLLNAHSLELKELVEEVTELRKGNTYERKRLDTIRVGITEEELREVRSVLREYYSKEIE